MINTTDQLQFLETGKTLHCKIVLALATAADLIEKNLGRQANPKDSENFGYVRQTGPHNHDERVVFNEGFLNAAFDYVQTDSQNKGSKKSIEVMRRYFQRWAVPATGLASFKHGLKLVLVELWRDRALLLPSTFRPSSHFPLHLFDHPLLNWVQTFDPESITDDAGRADSRRLRYYGPRIVWTTDWQTASDVRLDDIASLNRALVLYRQGKSATCIAGGTQLPLSLFAASLLRAYPLQASFSKDDLVPAPTDTYQRLQKQRGTDCCAESTRGLSLLLFALVEGGFTGSPSRFTLQPRSILTLCFRVKA